RGAARAALQNILHSDFSGGASQIRAFWNRFKGLSPAERWYKMLQEENGSALEAARNILQPENEIGVPGAGHSISLPLNPGQKSKFRGESLRAKRNPSVTELLIRHALAASDVSQGVEFTSLLSQWEQSAAVSPARALMRRAMD